MANFFDTFDSPKTPVAAQKNFFDTFDDAPPPAKLPSREAWQDINPGGDYDQAMKARGQNPVAQAPVAQAQAAPAPVAQAPMARPVQAPAAQAPVARPVQAPVAQAPTSGGFFNTVRDWATGVPVGDGDRKGSVLETLRGPAVAAPVPEDKMLNPEFVRKVEAKLNSLPKAQRADALALMVKRPDVYGRAAKVVAARYAMLDQVVSPTAQNFDPRLEAQKARFEKQGRPSDLAELDAKYQALSGELRPDFDQMAPDVVGEKANVAATKRAKELENADFLDRVAAGARSQYTKSGIGLLQAYADLTGDKKFSGELSDAIRIENARKGAIPEGKGIVDKSFQSAMTSLAGQAPMMVLSTITGTAAPVLAQAAIQGFGNFYSEGRAAGLSGDKAAARAISMATAEVFFERFGMTKALAGLRAHVAEFGLSSVPKYVGTAIAKEIPTELATTTTQYAVNMMPEIGLNKNPSLSGLYKELEETLRQTVLQAGVTAGVTIGAVKGVGMAQDKLRGKQGTSTDGLAELMARSRGFLTPEARTTPAARTAPVADAEFNLGSVGAFSPGEDTTAGTDLGEVGAAAPGEDITDTTDIGDIGAAAPGEATSAGTDLGEVGAAAPGEAAPKAEARARRVAELTAQIEDSGVSAEDAAVIAENRINEAETKQEKLGAKAPKTALPTNRVEELTEELLTAGFPLKEAKQRATELAKQEERDDAEAAKAVGRPSARSTTVAGQPTGTTATEGPTGTEFGGVVPTGATAEGTAVGEKPQFRPLTDEEKTKTEAPATETKTDIETAADQAREAIKETKKGQRGRPKLVLTPEQEASKAAEGRATKAAYQRADRAIKKQTKILESAINTGNQTNRRAAYKELLKLESAIRGTAAGIAAKATLEKHRNRFTPTELDSLKREVKAETQQALPSIGSATYKSDPKLGKVTNGAQAIAQILKTGNPFQQMLAKRIRGFVNGVKIVVVEDGAPIPARLQSGRAAEQWANARGMYVPSEKTVYIRGDSFGNSQGTNNVTILHELLHAATYQKLKLGQLALERGWSSDNAVTLATQDLQRTMDSAKKRFDELLAAGKLPAYIQDLSTQAKVFSNLDEFLAYGMSDDAMQTFLLGAKGYEGNANFFSRFVNSIRNYFGMDVDSINALSDLVLVTDKLLSARKSPTMRLLEAADKATAKREELALPSWFGGDKTAKSTKVQPSANVARLAKMLGSKLYGTPDDIARVSLKELFQNSFDAIKEGLEKKNEPWHITKGKIDIKADSKTRTISITDNGPGMPTSVMGNQFLQIAGTVKGTSRASGGLGVAKMLFLFENKQLEVVSLRDGVLSRMTTTGEDLKAALDDPDRGPTITTSTDPKTVAQYTKTLFPDGHGTSISIQVPESYKDESTGEDKTIRFDTYDLKFSKVLTNSPLFNDIDVTFSSGGSPSMLDIGNGFPVADYTPFANVRFAWGTARIYVSKKVEDSYGENTHILSNGLWQFSKTLKDKPGWDGKSIKRRFYIDVTPDESVKPEDAGYPFDLNRQNFSKAADGDFSKIFNYVTALYRQVDFASEVQNFGTVQYINADGNLTKAELLEPKAPTTDNAFTLIKPGDAVEVRDGVLYVNNRKIPELTNDDLKNTAIRIDELTIPQDQIDPSKVMVHDNMATQAKKQGSATSRLYDLEDSDNSRYSVGYILDDKYSFTVNNDDGTRTKFVGTPEDIASDLEEVGILTPQVASGATLSGNARAKFGKRYDTYLQTIGSVFQQLRDALIAADPEYNTPPRGGASLSKIGIGVSLDNEYYGVSTILPFEAMFINPATTALKGSASQIAVSMIGTMQHELAHYKVRSHDAAFASEMQRVMNLLDTYDGIDMSAVKKKLSAFIQNNNDIFTYLDGEFKSGNYKPVGNRLKDSGSFQARNESAVESMEGAGSAGGRGPSLSRITQSGTPNAGQVGVSEGDVDEDAEGTAERSQRQLDKDVDLALNKVAESKDNETLAKAVGLLQLARNPKNIIPQLQLLWNAATYYERNALVRLPTMDFLVSWAGKKVPELRNTYDLMQKMGGMTQQILKQSGVLTTDVHRAFLEDSGLRPKLENLVFAATIAQVDPSDTSAKLRNAKLDTMYADLGSKGQELYNRIKRHFENLSDLYSKLLDDQIKNSRLTAEEKSNLMAELRKMYETGKKITPYFPLTRHGDYWLSIGSGKNRQFYMYESLMGRDNAMQAMADKSIYRKPNESAAAFERRKQDNLKELIEDGTYDVGNDIHSLRRKSFDSSLLLRGVFDSIDSSNLGDPNAKESLKDAIYQIYLQTMPEQSFRNQFINRKNTTGFSTDLVRSVSTASVKMATQLARIKYAPYIRNSLSAARDSVSGQPKNEPFVSEMDRRADTTLGFHNETTGDKVARVFNKASFFFYLGGASTALLQPMSVFQTGMPVLAARYGAINATREMRKMLRVWNEYGVWRTNADGTKSWVAPSIENSKGLTPDERKAVRSMAAYGVSESTFSRALYEQKGSPTEKLSGPKVQLGKDAVSALLLGGLMHSSERISREMVFLTSFRLNMKQHGDFDRSVREAVNDTNEALFNYGGYNRPRYMQTGVGKVLTQFQMYPLQVTLFLLNNFKQMIVPMDDSTRKEATIKFFGTMFTTGVLAGAIGLPIAAVAGLLGAFWRKLDEEELLPEDLKSMDPMFWFRTIFLPSQLGHITIGGKTLSSIIERGPLNALTGLDISGRTGMSNLWSHDSKEYKTVREELVAAALDRAGPSVSMVLSLADAYDAFSKGDMQKGVEKLLPAGFRNFVIAHKYATEGAKDVTGVQIMSKDSFRRGELIGQAIGFRPDLLANAQYVNFRANGLALRIENERTKLLNSLGRVTRDLTKEGPEALSDVFKEIHKFNSKNPSYRITEKNMKDSLDKRAEQQASSFKGVVLTDKNAPVFIRSLAASRKELAEREKEAKP